jgi:glutamate synthase (ferredoxin)
MVCVPLVILTKDGFVIMASEIGVLDIKPEDVIQHGRLEPGKMFLVDMNEGRIIEDDEIKDAIVTKRPYRKWLDDKLHLAKYHIPIIQRREYRF